jgi:hypothetical protein
VWGEWNKDEKENRENKSIEIGERRKTKGERLTKREIRQRKHRRE